MTWDRLPRLPPLPAPPTRPALSTAGAAPIRSWPTSLVTSLPLSVARALRFASGSADTPSLDRVGVDRRPHSAHDRQRRRHEQERVASIRRAVRRQLLEEEDLAQRE